MPIPRHAAKEFFIQNHNRLIYRISNTNEVIIYDPDGLFSFFLSSFSRNTISTFFRDEINRLFALSSDRDKFILEMSKIFNETVNNRNSLTQFRNCLDEFLRRHENCNDICILCEYFISDIPSNNEIQNLLGNELIIDFEKGVSIFYKKSMKKRDRLKRKSLYKQFKEFKIQKSYSEKKINYQMKNKIITKKWNLKSTHRKMKMIRLLNF